MSRRAYRMIAAVAMGCLTAANGIHVWEWQFWTYMAVVVIAGMGKEPK